MSHKKYKIRAKEAPTFLLAETDFAAANDECRSTLHRRAVVIGESIRGTCRVIRSKGCKHIQINCIYFCVFALFQVILVKDRINYNVNKFPEKDQRTC